MSEKIKITAASIREGMLKAFCAPEWAVMWEVNEGTGRNLGRSADAVMMSLWPSRGLELHGIEIKISRSDWKREAADPTKAEAVAKYCDRWWLHTAPGVVQDLAELPPAWGLREFDGKRWRTLREAAKTPAEPVNRIFLASLLRRADDLMKVMIRDAVRQASEEGERERERQRAMIPAKVEAEVKRRLAEVERRLDAAQQFEEAFGKASPSDWGRNPAAFGRAARALSEVNGGFGPLIERLRAAADEIEALEKIARGEAKL